MRLAPLLLCVSLCSAASAARPALPPSYADAASLDSPFTLQNEVRVPGKLLKPGGYTLVIKDHLTDRAILQVKDDSGKVESTFLGVFHSSLPGTGSTGPVKFETEKGHEALRGFVFPGGGMIEFVYPKTEAAAILTKSRDQVLAIDPASDNLRLKDNQLSREDAQVVTLWSLQAVKVTSGQSGVAAKKYIPQNASAVAAVRTSEPAAVPASPVQQAAASKRLAPVRAASPQVASNAHRPALAALPHTASNLPLLVLVMMGSFLAAIGTRFRRQGADAR